MARKSRKNIASADEHPVIKVWKTALYIRLSVEYNGKRGDSLETQRQIMEDCLALCPDVEITEIYIDNGVSGQTFDRQGFQKMLADIESGKIDCVVVKDDCDIIRLNAKPLWHNGLALLLKIRIASLKSLLFIISRGFLIFL